MTEKNMIDPSLGPLVPIPPNTALASPEAPWSRCHICRAAALAAKVQIGNFPGEGEVRMLIVEAHGMRSDRRSMSAADDPWMIAHALQGIHASAAVRGMPPFLRDTTEDVMMLVTNYIGERADYSELRRGFRESHLDALRRIIAERDAAQGVPSTLPEE